MPREKVCHIALAETGSNCAHPLNCPHCLHTTDLGMVYNDKTYMNLIAVTDIFGKTRAFVNLIEELSSNYDAIEIVDPYGSKDHQFINEKEAYTYFKENVGIKAYAELLYNNLQGKQVNNQVLLGFSIGASAIWSISSKLECFPKTRAICFYSSQIRNYLEINPKIIIDIYFAEYEQTYDVDDVQKILSCKSNVTCHSTSYLHGFMSEDSKNFNLEGFLNYLKILKPV